MHAYRSHTCGALRKEQAGEDVRLSGWVHRVRDHGGLLFIDLRDHYGMTQIVVDPDSPAFGQAEKLRSEWVIRSMARSATPARHRKSELPTGLIEVLAAKSKCFGLPANCRCPVFGDQPYPEDTRLRYRFLDLRREKLHQNIICAVKSSIRFADG